MGLLARLWDFCVRLPLFYSFANHQAPLDLPENALATKQCVNSPENRSCWYGNYNIWTDYEVDSPKTGIVREVAVSPDLPVRIGHRRAYLSRSHAVLLGY